MPKTLPQWLVFLKKSEIRLGLERVAQVYQRLIPNLTATVITIGGTNGKGSTSAFLDHVYRRAGYRVGKLSSPELFCYNEQISLDGVMASDSQICAAFETIDKTKQDIELSYFEYLTLAALWLFEQNKMDIVLLEVGLGGRLDAVNVVDCDCAVITNIELDHCEFLGDTREKIAREKIAITRPNTPFICGEKNPPQNLLSHLERHQVPAVFVNKLYQDPVGLLGQHQKINAQVAKQTIEILDNKHHVEQKDLRYAIANTKLLGRLQTIIDKNNNTFLLDVAHNEAGAQALAQYLSTLSDDKENIIAVFSALKDKNIRAIVDKIAPFVQQWHLCPLSDVRFSMTTITEQIALIQPKIQPKVHLDISDALAEFSQLHNKIVLVFGSFLTVSTALSYLNNDH